jgi:hypothetical protein
LEEKKGNHHSLVKFRAGGPIRTGANVSVVTTGAAVFRLDTHKENHVTDTTQNASGVEQTFVQNPFGAVTSKRVIFFRAKGWLSGGSREDIPLQHVTSVRLDVARSIVVGVLLALIGLSCLASGNFIVACVGLLLVAFGVLLVWGSPAVVVNTAGRDLNAAKGWPWTRGQANTFVDALRGQLFRN